MSAELATVTSKLESVELDNPPLQFCARVNKLIMRGRQMTAPADEQRLGMFITLENRVKLITSIGPEALIEEVGPSIYKYKTQILARDEDFFLKLKIVAPPTMKKESAAMVTAFGDSIREMFARASKPERDEIYKHVKDMLKFYVKYALARAKK